MYVDIYNQFPFELKVMMANGIEMEYIWEGNKVTVRTKNEVAIAEDGKGGYLIAERINDNP